MRFFPDVISYMAVLRDIVTPRVLGNLLQLPLFVRRCKVGIPLANIICCIWTTKLMKKVGLRFGSVDYCSRHGESLVSSSV